MLPRVFSILKKPFTWFWHLKKRYKALVLFILVIALGIVIGQISSATKSPEYKTAEAKKTDITEIVSESGNITVNGKTDVFSPTNGVVEEVFVRNGDTVEVGQELFTIKSSATEQEKSQALATYMTAKNAVDAAQANLHTLQSKMFAANQDFLNGKGNTNDPKKEDPDYIQQNADWLAAEAAYKNQQAVISAAQTALNTAALAYQATQNATVKATAQGVISNLSVAPLSSVKANTLTAPTKPLATIANDVTPEVIVSLSENDIAKVAEGQEVIIDVSAVADKTYKGVVSRVDTLGTDDNGVIRYNVYITITNPDAKLRPGMNVDVEITTQKLTNVLSVPNAAVKPYKGGRAVRVPGKKKGEIAYKPVKIGVKGTTRTQIISGIEQGQQVITSTSSELNKRPGPFGG